MSKIALVFSGQGSQYVGMGKDLYDEFDVVKSLYDGVPADIVSMSFDGPIEELSKTVNTQPAILVNSIACLLVLQEKGISSEAVLGFSLGEYSALVAAGVLSFDECFKLVTQRAEIMNSAVEDIDSTMYAVVGLTYEEVKNIIGDSCYICNYNTKNQIVIGGTRSNLENVIKLFDEEVQVVELNVSGAFHSPLLDDASKLFEAELGNYDLKQPNVSILSNYTGGYYLDIDANILSKQMNNTVKFYDNIKLLLNDGFDTFIELGPGRVTSSFIKKIGRECGYKPTVLNVGDVKSLQKTLEKLGG